MTNSFDLSILRSISKKAEEKLASFAAELPWISPDDLNPEAFSLFREELCAVLKESVSAP